MKADPLRAVKKVPRCPSEIRSQSSLAEKLKNEAVSKVQATSILKIAQNRHEDGNESGFRATEFYSFI